MTGLRGVSHRTHSPLSPSLPPDSTRFSDIGWSVQKMVSWFYCCPASLVGRAGPRRPLADRSAKASSSQRRREPGVPSVPSTCSALPRNCTQCSFEVRATHSQTCNGTRSETVHSSGLFHRTEVAVEPGQGFFDEFVPGRDVVGFIHLQLLVARGRS